MVGFIDVGTSYKHQNTSGWKGDEPIKTAYISTRTASNASRAVLILVINRSFLHYERATGVI